MSYTLDNGLTLPDVDGEMVALVAGTINFYGGAHPDDVRPEEAVARACQTLISYLRHQERMRGYEQARQESRRQMEAVALRVAAHEAQR